MGCGVLAPDDAVTLGPETFSVYSNFYWLSCACSEARFCPWFTTYCMYSPVFACVKIGKGRRRRRLIKAMSEIPVLRSYPTSHPIKI